MSTPANVLHPNQFNRQCDYGTRVCLVRQTDSGFTLIEVILSLIILGLVGAIGALGFTDAVRGYLYGVDNANIAGKAQAALDRINLELTHIDFWDSTQQNYKNGVTASSKTSITYNVSFGDDRAEETGVVLAYNSDAGTVTLNTESTGEKILVDDVTGFSLEYFDDPSDASGESSYTHEETMCIGVTLELTGTNGKAITFKTRIVPVFNLSYGEPL